MDANGFRALLETVASVPLERVVVRLSGESPLKFLHDTSTQEVADLQPGQGALLCFLNEKGRVQAEARALVLDDGSVLLDAEPAARAYLTGWLARIAPLSACSVSDETEQWHVTAVRGSRAAEALGVDDSLVHEHDHMTEDGWMIVRVDWGVAGFDVLSRSPIRLDAATFETDVATFETDAATFEAARIAAGRPRFGVDITEDTLVNETPLLARAVAPAKGCYPGQESVARVQNLGRIRRHLVGIRFDAQVDGAPGSPVFAGGENVGVITSSARAPDGTTAIAHVRAEIGDGATVEVGGAAGNVRALG